MLQHFPIIQILIPFLGGLLCALTFNKSRAWVIAAFSIMLNIVVTAYIQHQEVFSTGGNYVMGGWTRLIAIEYQITFLSQQILLFLNLALGFILLFHHRLIESSILAHINERYSHLFYSILLLAHTGYTGAISSNDLFNIYVFIEIAALSSYILLAQGRKNQAYIAAIDYLILGTIGATMILISIGFFLGVTGSLNIAEISYIVKNSDYGAVIKVANIFFILGVLLKLGIFPFHFAQVRAYNSAPVILIAYISVIVSIFGSYLLFKFFYVIVEFAFVSQLFQFFIRPMALIAMILFSLRALMASRLRHIVVYSGCSSIGYVLIMLGHQALLPLLKITILADSLGKIALFIIIGYVENGEHVPDSDQEIAHHKASSKILLILCVFLLAFGAGAPLTGYFFIKMKLLTYFFANDLYAEIIIAAIASGFAMLYHLRLGKLLIFDAKVQMIGKDLYSIFLLVFLQYTLIFYLLRAL